MKISVIALLMFGGAAIAQELPDNLSLAVSNSKIEFPSVELNPELSFYSKNYDKVFRLGNYTYDTFDYGGRNVYTIDFNYRYFDSNTPHIFKVMPLPGVNVDAFMAMPCNAGYTQPSPSNSIGH